ncbi:MAG TPA: PD-(D/E)XK nuclease family protein [Jatrophihabitans sp.]|nr:PD-(D/E)XK nuclease family protein [Jatrophihabitans sp.]
MPEQLVLAAMPQRLFACTPSRLAAFDCPRRYRYTYLDRPPPPRGAPWAHNTVGATAHVALAQWYSLPRPHRTPEHGADLVHENWQPIGFRDAQQSARAAELTASWVERYLAGVDPRAEPVGVERTVATRSERLAVSGRVDRIDDRDGTLVVVDYKTGRSVPTTDDARGSAALALYVLATRRTLRRDCRRVELHHLPTGTVAAFEHDDASLRRHLDRAEATATDVVAATDTLAAGGDPDAVFPAVPSPGCRWCDFRRSCPEGRAAAPEAEPWAGLPDGLQGDQL